jgi:acyl-CoA reductase-like NAD-dependent aldehyde dehydrogenase
MYEQWHPLGVVGVITRLQLPGRRLGWNAMLAAGLRRLLDLEALILDPADRHRLHHDRRRGLPGRRIGAGVFASTVGGGSTVGERLLTTSASRWSRHRLDPWAAASAETVAKRFGRTILELGGNNAIIVTPTPTSNGHCARSSSARSARPVSAAPRRAGSSSRTASIKELVRGSSRPTRPSPSATRSTRAP